MKPILFNTDMVRAILDGRKTVTRRIVKPQPWGTCPNTGGDHELEPDNFCGGVATGFVCRRCGHGVCPPHMKYPVGEALFRPMCWPGDILYVRETWRPTGVLATPYAYRADEDPLVLIGESGETLSLKYRWRPSIHMPKGAARLFLRVTAVRAERLKEIDAAGIRQEGLATGAAHCGDMEIAQQEFALLWNSTIKLADLDKYGWDANPWVWVIEFERISK